jgi:hypothetical protein
MFNVEGSEASAIEDLAFCRAGWRCSAACDWPAAC